MLHKTLETRARATTDLGEFTAIAAAYTVDRVNERILKGAFATTIKRWQESDKMIPLHWDHSGKAEDIIGTVDPGSLIETDDGLQVKGQLDIHDNAVARSAWRLMKKNAVALSFGYMVVADNKDAQGVRELRELDVFEITITPAPANPDTRFIDLKKYDPHQPRDPGGVGGGRWIGTGGAGGATGDRPSDGSDQGEAAIRGLPVGGRMVAKPKGAPRSQWFQAERREDGYAISTPDIAARRELGQDAGGAGKGLSADDAVIAFDSWWDEMASVGYDSMSVRVKDKRIAPEEDEKGLLETYEETMFEVETSGVKLPDKWADPNVLHIAPERSLEGDELWGVQQGDLKAVWTTAYMNDLPDGAFLYIAPGGSKDGEGKTTPRSLRYFPYKNADGSVDLPHLRNALARIPQAKIPQEVKDRLTAKAQRILDNSKSVVNDGRDRLRAELLEKQYDQLLGDISLDGTEGPVEPVEEPEPLDHMMQAIDAIADESLRGRLKAKTMEVFEPPPPPPAAIPADPYGYYDRTMSEVVMEGVPPREAKATPLTHMLGAIRRIPDLPEDVRDELLSKTAQVLDPSREIEGRDEEPGGAKSGQDPWGQYDEIMERETLRDVDLRKPAPTKRAEPEPEPGDVPPAEDLDAQLRVIELDILTRGEQVEHG